jgi:uncharacterized protein (TIGR02172 family)
MPVAAPPTDPPPGAALVGRGYTAEVYAWGPGWVLKLFHPGSDRERAEREYRVTRAVHATGLPAPAAHDLVEVAGRWGVVFDRVEGPSLFDHVRARPWRLTWAVRVLSELHTQIHRCPAPPGLPTQRAWVAGRIAAADVPAAVREAALRRLAALPDGAAVCHGDFHPGNILVTSRGPVVIDWGRVTRGHPLGDVACTAWLIRTQRLPPWSPDFLHVMLRATRPVLYRRYLAGYLRRAGGTRRAVEAWLGPLTLAAGADRSVR